MTNFQKDEISWTVVSTIIFLNLLCFLLLFFIKVIRNTNESQIFEWLLLINSLLEITFAPKAVNKYITLRSSCSLLQLPHGPLQTLTCWSAHRERTQVLFPDVSLQTPARDQIARAGEKRLITTQRRGLSGFSAKTFLVINKTTAIMQCWSLLISLICVK